MSRSDFLYQLGIHIDDILLDPVNPRIRSAQSQEECIVRVLHKEEQILVLIKSIAKDGLTTMPILIYPDINLKWIVKDGNRRITALKLLNNPDLCPHKHLQRQIKPIRENFLANIPTVIDCLSSSNQEAIIKEVISRHSGAMGGAGQLDWSAYLRTYYLINNGHPAEYKHAGQYLFWAEKHGISVDDYFPITSISRFFTTVNLKLLGFRINHDELIPIISEDEIIKMASRVISDFSTKKVQVNDVFTPRLAKQYLDDIRTNLKIFPSADGLTTTDNLKSKDSIDPEISSNNVARSSSSQTNQSENSTMSSHQGRPRGSATKPPWDRKKLFKPPLDFIVPSSEAKVKTIISEIRNLNVQINPLAVTMLLRGLIELSDSYYRKKQGIQDKKNLAANIEASADSMFNKALIGKSQLELIKTYTGTDKSIFHIDTLQRYLHRTDFHPNFQTINTFWDEISSFIKACWQS